MLYTPHKGVSDEYITKNRGDWMKKIEAKEVWNIPNMLCYLRILLIPIFVTIYLNAQTKEAYYLAAGIIFISGVTDFLDGYIARKYNKVTELGKFIDPLADKLTQMGISIMLVFKFELAIILVSVFFVKEFVMSLVCFILFEKKKKRLDSALWYGKVATAGFYVTTFFLISNPTLGKGVANVLIMTATGLLLFAFVKYVLIFHKMYKEN